MEEEYDGPLVIITHCSFCKARVIGSRDLFVSGQGGHVVICETCIFKAVVLVKERRAKKEQGAQ